MKKVAVIMGSDSDFPVMKNAVKSLKDMGIPVEVHVLSAHRTPAEAGAFASSARQNGFGVIIAAAGKAAHLAGVLAGHTTLPVIGVPMKASVLDGMDALLATVQMPKGVPVATVAIDGADNAALLAAQILAVSEPALADKLEAQKQEMARQVLEKDKKLQAEAAALWLWLWQMRYGCWKMRSTPSFHRRALLPFFIRTAKRPLRLQK